MNAEIRAQLYEAEKWLTARFYLFCVLCFLMFGGIFTCLYIKRRSQRKEIEDSRQEELLRELGLKEVEVADLSA